MLRVSVLELPARWADTAAALAETDALLGEGPTDLAIVPELAFTGYVSPAGDFDVTPFAEAIYGPTTRAAGALCRRHGTALVAPLVLREGTALYNAAVVLGTSGAVQAIYRKRHPWIPELWATPGQTAPPVFELGGLRVTIAICYDAHFLEEDAVAELSGADLLVFTSAWVDEEDSRRPLLRRLARQFGLTVANANWRGGVVRVPGQGGSCFVGPDGAVIAGGRRIDHIVEPRACNDARERRSFVR